MQTESRNRYEVGALKRGLLILDCFTDSPDRVLTASEVARTVGIHRATAFRFLSTLESSGYIQPAERPGCYRLGNKWHPAEPRPTWPAALPLISVPILKELAEETGETADMGVFYQGEVTMVQVIEGSQSVRARQRVGASRPAHLTAIGKVLLAALNDEALEEWIRTHPLVVQTPNSISSPQRLLAELAEVRRCGYAVDEQEFELGLTCVAVPVLDASGAAIAGVAISGPSSRLTYHRIPDIVAAIQRAAERLGRLSRASLSPASA
ncbi:MAG: IclR family transcriptional regulator [Chloroflexota bacterium]